MPTRLRFTFAAAAALLVAATPSAARADETVRRCIASYERAQVLSHQGQLGDARRALSQCLDERCPATLRKDCGAWLADVEQRQPSIVVRVEAAKPAAITSVELDAKPWVLPPAGRSAEVDPGSHVLTLRTAEGSASVRFVATEGQKLQSVSARFAPPAAPTAPPLRAEARPIWPSLLLAGVGVVSVGSFAFFGLTGRADQRGLDACDPHCTHDDVSRVRTKYIVADVSLLVAAVSFVASAVLLATGGGDAPRGAVSSGAAR